VFLLLGNKPSLSLWWGALSKEGKSLADGRPLSGSQSLLQAL